jgi:hypothetical protein
MRKTIIALATAAITALTVTPASAAYGNEAVTNYAGSSRLLWANYGRSDMDGWKLNADQCARYRLPGTFSWFPAVGGPMTVTMGEDSVVIHVESKKIDPYTLNWICVF